MTLVGRWAVLAAVVPLFLVAGCGGDEPKPKMAATTSAAPTPTPTPTATPSPAAWEVKTNAGAVAFAKHWVLVFNETQRTRPEREPMKSLSTAACRRAATSRTCWRSLYGNGGRFKVKAGGLSKRSRQAGSAVMLRLACCPADQTVARIFARTSTPGTQKTFPGGAGVLLRPGRVVWKWMADDPIGSRRHESGLRPIGIGGGAYVPVLGWVAGLCTASVLQRATGWINFVRAGTATSAFTAQSTCPRPPSIAESAQTATDVRPELQRVRRTPTSQSVNEAPGISGDGFFGCGNQMECGDERP